jgi:hypothetical protein
MIWNELCSASLKVLHRTLVGLSGFSGLERTEVTPPSSLRILFARVQPVFAGI